MRPLISAMKAVEVMFCRRRPQATSASKGESPEMLSLVVVVFVVMVSVMLVLAVLVMKLAEVG